MPGSALIIVLAAALPAAAGASVLLVLYLVCHMQKGARERQANRRAGTQVSIIWPGMTDKLEGSITKTRIKGSTHGNIKELLDSSIKQSSKIASVWRSTYPVKAFKWAENPHLVSEAVECGWSTFAFTFANMDVPIPPKLWESCTRSAYFPDKLGQPELTWEVNTASSEYMQRIRLNPSLSNPTKRELFLDGLISTVQSLQTTLPLPGPPLGPLSFPQEGYYEITVFGTDGNHEGFAELSHFSINENEHAHLIAPRSSSTHRGYASFDAPSGGAEIAHKRPSSFSINDFKKEGSSKDASGTAHSKEEEHVDVPALQSATNEQQICAVGLSAGSAPPFRLPGSDAASIGFFSNGRIFINGKEQKKPEGWQRRIWGPAATTASSPVIVGCGYDPGARRLFFTLNGDMVEEIMLPPLQGNTQNGSTTQGKTATDKSMEFTAHPLFPTIGANYTVTVTANLGQAAFAYAAANAQRVADPCFRRPPAGGKAAGEDSADLFSMGRINSDWLADAGGGSAAMQTFASPGRVKLALLTPPPPSSSSSASSCASTDPVNPSSGYLQGDSDLFEITIDSRTF